MLKKMLYLIAATTYSWVRGRATTVPAQPQKILVVQMAKLGDMVCTTPVFSAIKKKYSASELWVLGNTVNKEVLAGNKDVNGYLVFDGTKSVIRRLRSEKFDVAIITGAPDYTSAAVAFLANIPCIIVPDVIGDTPLQDYWYRQLSHLMIRIPVRMGNYIPREYLRMLEPLDIFTAETTKRVEYTDESAARVDTYLASLNLSSAQSLVGVLPGAGNKIKRWMPERFAEVIDILIKDGVQVVLVGGKGDIADAQDVLTYVQQRHGVHDTCGVFVLEETKALIARLDLLVGVDTGPIYIAEALAIPTVDIVGPVNESEQPPQGPRHVVVVPSLPRIPEISLFAAHRYDSIEVWRQLEVTTVEMVVEACRGLLRSLDDVPPS